jgi:hypothetical protein
MDHLVDHMVDHMVDHLADHTVDQEDHMADQEDRQVALLPFAGRSVLFGSDTPMLDPHFGECE